MSSARPRRSVRLWLPFPLPLFYPPLPLPLLRLHFHPALVLLSFHTRPRSQECRVARVECVCVCVTLLQQDSRQWEGRHNLPRSPLFPADPDPDPAPHLRDRDISMRKRFRQPSTHTTKLYVVFIIAKNYKYTKKVVDLLVQRVSGTF